MQNDFLYLVPMLEAGWFKQNEDYPKCSEVLVMTKNRRLFMLRKQVKVQMDRAHIHRVQDVAQELRNAGMDIQDEIIPLGHFRGVADTDKIEHLKSVPGVAVVDVIGDEGQEEKDDYSV